MELIIVFLWNLQKPIISQLFSEDLDLLKQSEILRDNYYQDDNI